jgi:hypothetical protein
VSVHCRPHILNRHRGRPKERRYVRERGGAGGFGNKGLGLRGCCLTVNSTARAVERPVIIPEHVELPIIEL